MNIVSNICLLLVVVLALQWHSSPSQALNIGNHPDCGLQPGDPNTEPTTSEESDQFPEFGGRYTTPFKYPWMAKLHYEPFAEKSLKRKRFLKSICSATILNERWALAAAHCFHDKREKDYRPRTTNNFFLYAGRFDFSQDADESDTEQKRGLERAILHPQYNPRRNYDFDLALLKLKTPPLRFGAQHKVGAICLPTKPNLNPAGVWMKMLGWGYRDYDDPTCRLRKRKLREVTSRAWSYQECKLALKGLPWLQLYESLGPVLLERHKLELSGSYSSDSDLDSTIDNSARSNISLDEQTKHSICWGEKGKASTCGGDSGGPMVAWDPKMTDNNNNHQGRWVQYGVNSWRNLRNYTKEGYWRSPSILNVFVRVSQFTSWIWDMVNEFSTRESDGITIATEPVRTVEDSPPPALKRCKPLIHAIGNVPNMEVIIRYFKKLPIKLGRSGKTTCVMP